MAEKKPWARLEDAISDLWDCFLGASDDTCLSLFCKTYTDERIPESFLEKFLSKLKTETEAANWTRNEDPDYNIPRELMTKVFKAEKKKMQKKVRKMNKKLGEDVEKKEEVGEEEIVQEEQVGEEEIVQEEQVDPTLTDEQLEKNRKSFLKNSETRKERKNKLKEERAEKNRATKLNNKMENQLVSMNKILRGVDRESDY